VLETGINSVSPSTIPRIIALKTGDKASNISSL